MFTPKLQNITENEKFKGSIKVLLMEDNKMNQQSVEKTIRLGFAKRKYSVDLIVLGAEEGGQECLDYLVKLQNNKATLPDVIIMDEEMPVMLGSTATKLIRDKLQINKNQIYIVTHSTKKTAAVEGANYCVDKPFMANNPIFEEILKWIAKEKEIEIEVVPIVPPKPFG